MQKMLSIPPQQAHAAHFYAERAEATDPSLVQFDTLPDAAHVRLPAVVALFGISRATVWRWVKEQRIPAPKHFGVRVSAWSVRELRAALNAASPR